MRPSIQASNIRFCDIHSNSMTVKWDNGNGDRRVVIITPEKLVYDNEPKEDPIDNGVTFGDYGYCSTANNPDPMEVRQNFPGYYPGYKGGGEIGGACGCGCGDCSSKCNVNISYVSPDEALPIDGKLYKPNISYGDGDELFITNRGVTSSYNGTCPSPSPSPSPSPGYEWIIETDEKNGSFVVYEGTGSEVTILNLKPETGYYISVYEFDEECTEYLHEPNSKSIITSCKVDTSKITINVTDCRTCRPVVSMVEIIDKCGKVRSIGSTDRCGKYVSIPLEVASGYKIKVTAPNYDDYFINNIYIQPQANLRRSEIHPNWTQGTKILPVYSIPGNEKNYNIYNVKL